MVIFLRCCEVLVSVVLLFRQGSSSASIPSAKSSLEPLAILRALISSYEDFYLSFL
jgi:hypothetical protein